ncbi:MAG: hypothetical protein LBL47_04350, partial [Lactobacillus sp.]|nr:hypothetical protein [Lactobacillus sp.]
NFTTLQGLVKRQFEYPGTVYKQYTLASKNPTDEWFKEYCKTPVLKKALTEARIEVIIYANNLMLGYVVRDWNTLDSQEIVEYTASLEKLLNKLYDELEGLTQKQVEELSNINRMLIYLPFANLFNNTYKKGVRFLVKALSIEQINSKYGGNAEAALLELRELMQDIPDDPELRRNLKKISQLSFKHLKSRSKTDKEYNRIKSNHDRFLKFLRKNKV